MEASPASSNVISILQSKLEEEAKKLQTGQTQAQKAILARQTLDSQLNENSLVKEELGLLKPGSDVYKLVGPALIKQDLTESRQNVDTRIKFISDELKRYDSQIKQLEKSKDEHSDNIRQIQMQIEKITQP